MTNEVPSLSNGNEYSLMDAMPFSIREFKMGGKKKSGKKNKPQPEGPEQKNLLRRFSTYLPNPYSKTPWVALLILLASSIGCWRFLPDLSLPYLKGFISSDQQTTLFGSVTKTFILGDSTVDSGAYMFTPLPYGLDWPNREGNDSMGRFSNGFTLADYLATKFGVPLPVSFNDWVKGGRMESPSGINFASAGCGLFHTTRPPFEGIECLSIAEQLLEMFLARIQSGERLFHKAVVLISVGGNDIMVSLRGNTGKEPKSFGTDLGSNMAVLLENLYRAGGRKFLLNNVGPVGCIPNIRALSVDKKSCNKNMNEAARAYNLAVRVVSRKLKEKFKDITIVLDDSYMLLERIVEDPLKYGFKNFDAACCGNWSEGTKMFECNNGSMLCDETERRGFLFFDGAHTTAAANELFTERCLEGDICSEVRNFALG